MSGPSLRDRMKPLELVGISAVLGVFAGGIALIGSGSITIALTLAGIAFIVALLVLAMLALATGSTEEVDPDVPVLDRQKPPRKRRSDKA